MLKKVIIENFGPIGEKIEFSMEKCKTEQYPENIIKDTNLLKTVYIYGANNSGKSRMLESLKLLVDITQMGKELFYSSGRTRYLPNYTSEKLKEKKFITKIGYEFIILKKEYKYQLELDFRNNEIKKEELYVDNKEILKRGKKIIILGEEIEVEKDIFAISHLATQSGKIDVINIFYNYLKNIIFIDQQRESYSSVKNKSSSIDKIDFLKKNIKEINSLMHNFGFDFKLNVKKEETAIEKKNI